MGISHPEADHNLIQERGRRERNAQTAKVVPGMKRQFVNTGLQRIGGKQRLARPSFRIRHGTLNV
jgi:hypothetical protein